MRAVCGLVALVALGALAGCAAESPTPGASPAPAAGAATAAPVRSGGFALVAGGADPVARASAPPGDEIAVGLRLANASDAPRVLALAAEPGWLAVPPAVVVPPRQSVPVAAVVRVPGGAAGILRGRVVARAEGDRAAAVSVSYESSVQVAVEVAAAP